MDFFSRVTWVQGRNYIFEKSSDFDKAWKYSQRKFIYCFYFQFSRLNKNGEEWECVWQLWCREIPEMTESRHHEMLPWATHLFSLVLARKANSILHLSCRINPGSGNGLCVSSFLMFSAYQSNAVLSRYQRLAMETKALELKEGMLKFPSLIINFLEY